MSLRGNRLPEVESIRPSQAQSSKSVRECPWTSLVTLRSIVLEPGPIRPHRLFGPIIINLSLDTNRSSSFGRTGNAYDVRFSPGGSSGAIVTAIAANMAVLGNGTDTGNSIRMPAATSALVGVFPTRGLVSIAGIAPLDWLLDNTGPIARTTTDAAIALGAMAGEDPLDPRTVGWPSAAQRAPDEPYLKADALKGKRFGVPAFILSGGGIPFHGLPASVPDATADKLRARANTPLRPETREMFMKGVEALRAAGAEVVVDAGLLPSLRRRPAGWQPTPTCRTPRHRTGRNRVRIAE
jgi:Asp-tRNA(Asn)/Glu-tRNA(Gln) amidotransferase A subunit family amidase